MGSLCLLQNLNKAARCMHAIRLCSSAANSTNGNDWSKDGIVLPKRIERSSTDILYALASTVGRDFTAPHYKYHDDPYLIPTTNLNKRAFAMAQESGKKAARWIQENHRELFMHKEADPPIEAFTPKAIFNEESEVSVQTLEELIRTSQVSDAMLVYDLMKQKNIEVDEETKQSLLELLCFYNHEDPLPMDLHEERAFLRTNEKRDRARNTWKDGGMAEILFQEFDKKTEKAYAAIIQGMAKYYQAERAYALFMEALEKGHRLDTSTFNSIISIINFLKDTVEERWKMCREMLQKMNELNHRPDLGTLNATLESISTFGNYKLARSVALQTLAEFQKRLHIKPSLATYYYILIIFCRERGPISHVLVDILNTLEQELAKSPDESFSILHPKDTYFFLTAMDICHNHLQDLSLAKRVHALLLRGRNYDFIGDTFKETIYYRHYFVLLSQLANLDEFMSAYDELVPNVYIPEPGIMEEILKMIELNGAIDLVPRIWSDMIIFDHISRESLILRLLKIMIMNDKPEEYMNEGSKWFSSIQSGASNESITLSEQFSKIAYDIYQRILESQKMNNKRSLTFSGNMIGDILTLLLRGNDFEKAVEVFRYIDKNQHLIPGTPTDRCLLEFIEGAIANRSPNSAIACLQYAVENQFETKEMVKRIQEGFTLDETHLSKIKSLVG